MHNTSRVRECACVCTSPDNITSEWYTELAGPVIDTEAVGVNVLPDTRCETDSFEYQTHASFRRLGTKGQWRKEEL